MTVIYGTTGGEGRRLAWPLLERAVRLHWSWTALPPVERSPRGKPLFALEEGRWFSLSHSGGLALCALSDGPVGVDVEVVRPRRAGLPRYVLSGEELEEFDGSWEDFYRLWTRKESWCKREDISLCPPKEALPPPGCCADFAGEGWRGAVCCHGAQPEGVVWLTAEELPEQGKP